MPMEVEIVADSPVDRSSARVLRIIYIGYSTGKCEREKTAMTPTMKKPKRCSLECVVKSSNLFAAEYTKTIMYPSKFGEFEASSR